MAWLSIPAAYLLGSIPFGFLIVKLREGRDVRTAGSGNIGATNVARSAGPVAGVLTLLLDTAKGFAAVWLARVLAGDNIEWIAAAAVVAVAGHMFPIWLKFKGGKGVATGLGAFIYLCWQAVTGAVVVFLLAVAISRYVSLGSILAAAALPPLLYVLFTPQPTPLSAGIAANVCAVLIIWKHRDNIRRIIAGGENRLRMKK
ncbi:MAG: glycerol-3-phosphate 1-O-acyltransferase PlsY [Acidobacteria bacterium]|nr:glycerol-3-phosphate 1-O-acyltransferase PlsY [Acidobacteriota bacterium]